MSRDDMRSLAELASGQRIARGDLNRLTADDWQAEWETLSSRFRYLDSCHERLIEELDTTEPPCLDTIRFRNTRIECRWISKFRTVCSQLFPQ